MRLTFVPPFLRRRFAIASPALLTLLALTLLVSAGGARTTSAASHRPPSLAGAWTLVAADRRLPDGSVERDYGAAPQGRLMIDGAGRYSLQIFKSERADFAAGDKALGTADEMRDAVLGSSTHFGSVAIDWRARTLSFTIEDASFPNWRGQTQVRAFELRGDILTYRVPPRADGSLPISVWRRQGS